MRLLLSLSVAFTFAVHADDFPKPFNTGNDIGKKPMPASEAVKLIEMPPGFKATVFAAEPDVQNPIACTWDSRGRLWVAENYTYADAKTNFDQTLRDRILIFEDTDGDGVADKRTVFCDNLQNLTSIELGYGGLYATTAPRMIFIPIKPGEEKPAGEPVTLLDGFDAWKVRHNIVNGLKWGPDGWLYGRHGIQATSHVGAPGTPDKDRVDINCCIWRYHPIRKTFEVVTWGGTNSWGLDWNEEGEGFFVNTVIGQLYHLIPGAHYERMYGQDPNPYIYQLLPQTADHYHFDTSKGWTNSRDGKANDLGGGHAHSGCMIYQGDNWPEQYRGKLFTLNLHGRRINCERLEKQGSGYVAKHEPDMIKFGDPWFRGVELTCGPDGGVYVLDWSDDGECHESDGVHRESGRIYKITYGTPKKADLGPQGDVARLDLAELGIRAWVGDEWIRRQAIPLIGYRIFQAPLSKEQLTELYHQMLEMFHKLNPAKKVLSGLSETLRFTRLSRILSGDPLPVPLTPELTQASLGLIAASSSPEDGARARLEVCEDLKSRPPRECVAFVAPLLSFAADNDDRVLPLLLWSTFERLVGANDEAVASPTCAAAYGGKIKIVLQNAARRYASSRPQLESRLSQLLQLATAQFDEGKAGSVLKGMNEGLRGQAKAPKPAGWDEFAAKAQAIPALTGQVRQLNVLFGSGRALDEIRQIALDGKADLAARKQALESLIAANPPDLRASLETLVKDSELLPYALVGLAKFDDAAPILVSNYGRVRADGKPAVMAAMCSRPAFAKALLEAVSAGKIARTELTPYDARQIAAIGDAEVSKRLSEVWGTVSTTSDQKKKRMAELKRELPPEVLKQADITAGRAVFSQTCAACHTLYDLGQQGANLGPNLTGSGRTNIDYLLENIVDPSAIVPADYKLSTLTLKDGRVLSGFISTQTDQTLTLRTMTGTENLPRADVTKTEASWQSLMPEGLLDTLTPQQRRDLFGFLMSK